MTTAVSPPPGSPAQMLPVPDPTLLTTAQLLREVEHLRGLIEKDLAVRDERFHGIDRATNLLNEQMTRVPTETDLKTGQLAELIKRDISGIYAVLEEREKRAKEAAELVATALREASRAQQEASAVSAQGLRESIAKNETIANQALGNLGSLITTLQNDVAELRVDFRGLIKERAGTGTTLQQVVAIIAVIVAVISVAYGVTRGG